MSEPEKRHDSWALWNAVRAFLSSGTSPTYARGLMGEVARNAQDTLLHSDLEAFWIPGLAALGLQAEFHLFPEEDDMLRRLLRERLRYHIPIPLFAFETSPPVPTDQSDPQIEKGKILRAGLVLPGAETGLKFLLESPAGTKVTTEIDAIQETFTTQVSLRRAQTRGERRLNRLAALQRWLAFAAAYPERGTGLASEDALIRLDAAAYLQEIAGQQGTAFARRLRHAAERLTSASAEADLEAADRWLREAVFLEMRLPSLAHQALLLPPTVAPTPVERHELIYLARAGTRDIRTLAARRLTYERQHSEVHRTLEQLAQSPDAWVRAATRSPVR